MFEHLFNGFVTAISFTNLLFCFFGVTMGTIIGVLPDRAGFCRRRPCSSPSPLA